MDNENKKKRKRKTISVKTKNMLLSRLAKGERVSALGREFNLSESTVRSIRNRAHEISKTSNFSSLESVRKTSYSRNPLIEKTEKALLYWIRELTQKNIPFDGELVKEKARKFHNHLKQIEPSAQMEQKEFIASTGWFNGFIRRNSLEHLNLKREISFLDRDTALNNISNDINITQMLEQEMVNDYGINFVGVTTTDEQDESKSMTADQIYEGLQLCSKLENYFLDIDSNAERTYKFQKKLQACIADYYNMYKRMVESQPVSSSDESDVLS